MVVSKSKYEEIRRRRLEENKKRMEELNLKKLSLDIRIPSPKKSPMKQAKSRVHRVSSELVPVRRSSRFADKPAVSYKEVAPEPFERRRSYSNRHRDLLNRIYASDEVRAYAIDRAEQLQSGLDPDYPSFVKPMLQSHVTGGFWLGLPAQFCKDHLPSRDEFITLVDESGDASETKYLAGKTGLSGGWRGFAIDHELVDGDALVFQLVSPIKFKVYIIRAYEDKENDEKNEDKENEDEVKEDKENNNENFQKNEDRDKNLDTIAKRTRSRK